MFIAKHVGITNSIATID